jgi:hypothetical protein
MKIVRYITLCPKYLYYLVALVYLLVTGLFVFVGATLFLGGETGIGLLLFFVSGSIFLWSGFYTKTFLHARIDTKNASLQFGNVFGQNEAPLNQVRLTGRFLHFLRIEIGHRRYFIQAMDDEGRDVIVNQAPLNSFRE